MRRTAFAFALAGMSVIPGGSFEPLYATKHAERVSVSRFALDREPVTRGEFLAFVKRNAQWRRSSISRKAADKGYLIDWASDLSAGNARQLERPVTSVSRQAAAAYCSAQGKRLPTVEEWEYAAAASDAKRNATRDRAFIAKLVAFYTSRSAERSTTVGNGRPNVYGVSDMHELIWELTADPAAHDMSGHEHHMFCASSAIGAADPSNYPAFMRYAIRSGINSRTTLNTLGFRCAANTAQ
jgi:formylglycine-generating enzyme required for sulfatase activity